MTAPERRDEATGCRRKRQAVQQVAQEFGSVPISGRRASNDQGIDLFRRTRLAANWHEA
jgi:hypothetical protein